MFGERDTGAEQPATLLVPIPFSMRSFDQKGRVGRIRDGHAFETSMIGVGWGNWWTGGVDGYWKGVGQRERARGGKRKKKKK